MDVSPESSFDTIVVGSGPGGATVARELSRRGDRVLILERGPNRPVSGRLPQLMSEAMVPGRSLLLTPQLLAMIRAITTGGSSVYYYATAFDPPYERLARHGVDISEEVEELKSELPCAPLPEALIGPAASRIMDSARSVGLDWKPLPKLMFQNRCRPDCDKCTLGCPYGAKWTSREFIDEAVGNGALFVERARVDKVVVEDGAATGVDAHVNGRRRRFHGSRVVVAAGGIGSPVILRASGITRAGRDFFFDPLVIVMGIVKGLSNGRELPMAAGINEVNDGYVMTDLVLPRLLYQLFTAEVGRFHRLFAHASVLPIMVKIRDSLAGRLTDSGGVRKNLSGTDRDKLRRGSRLATSILQKAGARGIFSSWHLATHPGGTVKIGDIVDSDLKTEVDNLYVCDASVIPEEMGLPPTLTILGLGKRLSKHLAATAAAA